MKKDVKPALRLAAISLLGIVLLNFPLLSTVSKGKLVAGIPVLFFYLFAVWAVLLVLIWQTVKQIDDDK